MNASIKTIYLRMYKVGVDLPMYKVGVDLPMYKVGAENECPAGKLATEMIDDYNAPASKFPHYL